MKKKLALVLSLVLCCAMLSGCTTLTALMGKQMANATARSMRSTSSSTSCWN